jgi:ABC-type phosphate/phosphonate transport system substrate-binding protein
MRIAVNAFDSQSGFRVFGECLAQPLTVSGDRIVATGSHLGSIRAVAAGKADLAAIDAATWQFAIDHEPAAREVAVVARSADAPGLPLITSPSHADKATMLLDCLTTATAKLGETYRAALHLRGIVRAAPADYQALKRPPFGSLRIALP